MAKPTLLVQISDIHIGGSEDGKDPIPRVEGVIQAIRSLPNAPDAVLVSGDLTDHGAMEEYEVVRELLSRLELPLHVLGGNHDDRARLREAFGLPGGEVEPIRYSVDVGDLRLVLLDSNVPGRDPGAFDGNRLRWLDEELSREPEQSTLLAVHHTPITTGIPEWDAINLAVADREALGEVVARHPQLRAIVGGCPVLSAPSAYPVSYTI